MNKLLSWLPLIIAGAVFVWGMALFITRFARLRNSHRPDPESLVLGAVSHSLKERGELAASLGELRTVHEKLLNVLPEGILWVDQRGNIGALNSTGQSLLGVKPGAVGLDASFVLDPFPWLIEALANGSDEPQRATDNNRRRWETRKITAPNSVGALVQFEDVTERENEERRQSIQNRFAELGEMTAGLAHQLKNGLAVLKGRGQLLHLQGHEEAAREIIQEASSLEQLASSFLKWARPISPELTNTDLAAVADEAISEIARRPCSLNILLERHGEGQGTADAVLLREALVNIVENACQASPTGGKVLVCVSNSMIEILDEGPGLDCEDFARIIRPFESGRQDGTGLGLPLAFKWLNAQGADLGVEKRDAGGSRFVIKW
ncbi:MAG: ATP-binding protein [Holophagaceae bacterium]|nr:ATP-binding protein [Holophagaceae bacterium]